MWSEVTHYQREVVVPPPGLVCADVRQRPNGALVAVDIGRHPSVRACVNRC